MGIEFMRIKPSVIVATLFTLLLSSAFSNNIVVITTNDIIVVIDTSSTNQSDYLDAINQARSTSHDCGEYGIMPPAPPLVWNDKLAYAAQIHSNDLAQSNTFSHTGSGTSSDIVAQEEHPGIGSSYEERAAYAGYTGWIYLGENIAAGYSTVQEVIDAWLSSPGHCHNLMNQDFTEVGMTKVYNSSSTYKTYWAQEFGDR